MTGARRLSFRTQTHRPVFTHTHTHRHDNSKPPYLCEGVKRTRKLQVNLLRRDLLPQLLKQFGGHISRGPHGIAPDPHDKPSGDLTDAVVCQLEPDIPGIVDSVLLTIVCRGEIPDKDVGRFHVQVDYLVLVEELQSVRNL